LIQIFFLFKYYISIIPPHNAYFNPIYCIHYKSFFFLEYF